MQLGGHLEDARVVYQLSLRLGASYSSTCWALVSHKIVSKDAVHELTKIAPKTIKSQLLPPGVILRHGWADVWVITERDSESTLAASPDDIFIFRLPEKPSSGYTWNFSGEPIDVVYDGSKFDSDVYGAPTIRSMVVELTSPARDFQLQHIRPFGSRDISHHFSIRASNTGAAEGEYQNTASQSRS